MSDRDKEYEPLRYEPIENDAMVVIGIGDWAEFGVGRENTVLCTYLGRSAFNNILIWDEEVSMRIFKEAPAYEQLKNFILENDYPAYLNQLEVPPEIQESYVEIVVHTVPDEVPEDWD